MQPAIFTAVLAGMLYAPHIGAAGPRNADGR